WVDGGERQRCDCRRDLASFIRLPKEGKPGDQSARSRINQGLNNANRTIVRVTEHVIDRREEQRVTGKTNERRIERGFGRMRINMLLEHVARNLRITEAVISRVVWQPVNYRDAEACGNDDERSKHPDAL